jgi:predicted lipoprotein
VTAGATGNDVFLSAQEARQTLFTALVTGLEFDADQRLGRPMGSFERPRPTRAEAWRSGRSLRNVSLSLAALRHLAEMLSDTPPTATLTAFDAAQTAAASLNDPVFAGVGSPEGRLKVEILQQRIKAAEAAALAEIGPRLGVSAGFNSADGD